MLNGKTCENFEVFKSFFYKSIKDIYGTHDWIADRAIKILYEHFPNDSLINSIYLNQNHMRAYYLYRTELPDTMINPLKKIYIETDSKNILTRKNFYINHSVALRQDGTMSKCNNENNLFRSARRIMNNYMSSEEYKSDMQATAIFLGYMSHLIGDACYIHHVYRKPNKSIEQQSKGEILKRTRNILGEAQSPLSQSIRNINIARNEFQGQSDTIQNSLFYCVWHTFYGKAHTNGAFQHFIVPDWNWYKVIKIKKIKKERDFEIYRKWWNGVIFHLNLAIFYTAIVINGLKSYFNF